jgi:hypothetical protein
MKSSKAGAAAPRGILWCWEPVQRGASKKKEMPAAAASPAVAASLAPKSIKGTLFEKFAPIKVVYEESDKAPEKMATDTCVIKKEMLNDSPVWISENGLVFDCDTTGEPGLLIGWMTDGKFKGK